jgi:hypothetical protein
LLASAAALALPAAASANPAYEPNNGIHEAYGPLAAGTTYDATISSDNDSDWYIVYVSGQGVLDVRVTNDDDDECCGVPNVILRDRDGQELNSTSASEGETSSIPYTTPGPGVYYIEVRGGLEPDTYQLMVTGPVTNGPRPGPAEITPNASRDFGSAFGPLAGDTLYGGSIDANGEEDWFFFNTAGPGTFEVVFTNIDDEECCGSPSVYLYEREGVENFESINSVTPSSDTIGRIAFTSPGPEQYFLQVRGGNPVDRYQFVVTPGSLLTSTTPAGASEACEKAQAKLVKKKEKLQQAKFDKQNAFSEKERKKAKKKLKKARKQVKKAKKKVKKFC